MRKVELFEAIAERSVDEQVGGARSAGTTTIDVYLRRLDNSLWHLVF